MATRTETDSLGSIDIDDAHWWGPQTGRARRLFRIGTEGHPPGLIRAVGRQKQAAAEANFVLGVLAADVVQPIIAAAGAVQALIPKLQRLRQSLAARAGGSAHIVQVGRDGRGAGHAGAGIRRLAATGAAWNRAPGRVPAPAAVGAAGRHGALRRISTAGCGPRRWFIPTPETERLTRLAMVALRVPAP